MSFISAEAVNVLVHKHYIAHITPILEDIESIGCMRSSVSMQNVEALANRRDLYSNMHGINFVTKSIYEGKSSTAMYSQKMPM